MGQNNEPQQRIKGWQSDIDTLLSLIKKEHYVYKAKILPEEMLSNVKILRKKIGEYSDERMLGELERVMYYLQDGHSYILPVSTKFQSFYLPLQFYIFDNGVFIIDADEPYKDLIGSKVLSINNISISKLLSDMNTYVHQDNKFTVKWFAPSVLRFRGVYEYYGLKAGSPEIEMGLSTKEKKKYIQNISFVPATNFRGIPKLIPSKAETSNPPPLYLSDVENYYWFKRIPDKKAIYIQFNQVLNKEHGQTLFQFGNSIDSVLHVDKPKLLIIDVRHNNGGSLEYLQTLVQAIKNFDQQQKSAKIIVITGRNTFSAAQVFISLLNRDTHAIFAGEPSSSSPNFVGEENYFVLPYSKAVVSISNKYHETIPGDKRKWIEPNFPVLLSSSEYFKNQDPVLEYVLKKIK